MMGKLKFVDESVADILIYLMMIAFSTICWNHMIAAVAGYVYSSSYLFFFVFIALNDQICRSLPFVYIHARIYGF